ncbi:MAG: helix-turn-helix domain-containing protein [Candidatus Hadarchaeales archaeon]
MKMKPPCEEMFKDVLPTIRAILVKDLVERHNLNQVEVAKRLGITQPAVSQYLRSLRGTSRAKALLRRGDFMRSIKELSDLIAKGEVKGKKVAEMYCNLCEMLRGK